MLTIRKSVVALAVLFLLFSAEAFAQFMVPFTADMSFKSKNGDQMNGKYYVGNNKIRMDMDTHGQQVSMITDPSTKTSYSIMHKQKMYMEFHAGQNMMQRGPKMPDLKAYDPNNPCASNPDMTCKNEGSETVNGRSCDKWLFTDKKDGQSWTAWIDKKLHFPIKTVMSDGSEFDLANVQEGAVPPSTFEVPAGYQKMDMGGMMGGRMPQ